MKTHFGLFLLMASFCLSQGLVSDFAASATRLYTTRTAASRFRPLLGAGIQSTRPNRLSSIRASAAGASDQPSQVVKSIFDSPIFHEHEPESNIRVPPFPLESKPISGIDHSSNSNLVYSQRLFSLKVAYHKWMMAGSMLDYSINQLSLRKSELDAAKKISSTHINQEILDFTDSKQRQFDQATRNYQAAWTRVQDLGRELEESQDRFLKVGQFTGKLGLEKDRLG